MDRRLFDLDVGFGRENLPALVLSGLEVDVVRAAALAALLVLDVGRGGQRVMRTALVALHGGGLFPRNCHKLTPVFAVPRGRRRDLNWGVGRAE